MRLDDYKKQIIAFLKRSGPGVLVVRGPWGCGKTHCWDRVVDGERTSLSNEFYSRVSLFGLSSEDQLRASIVANVEPLRKPKNLLERAKNLVRRKCSGFGAVLERAEDMPYVGKLLKLSPSLINAVAWRSVQKYLICFDDLERATHSLSMVSIMGLVDQLRAKGCKIALIMSDERLSEQAQDDYTLLREKVVDLELHFEPEPSDVIEIAFPDAATRTLLVGDAVKLCIRNIRVLRRMTDCLEVLRPHLAGASQPVVRQIEFAVVLMVWAFYSHEGDAPTLENIEQFEMDIHVELRKSRDATSPKEPEPKWRQRLREYGWFATDKLDLEVARVVRVGCVLGDGLAKAIREKEALLLNEDHQKSVRACLRMYSDSLENNEQQIIEFARGLLDTEPKCWGLQDVDAIMELLDHLDNSELANQHMDRFLKSMDPARIGALPLWSDMIPIRNKRFKQALRDACARTKLLPTLREAIDKVSGSGWSTDDESVIAAATEDEFFQVFASFKGDFASAINGVLRLGAPPEHRDRFGNAVAAMRRALRRIANQSELNRKRLQHYLGTDAEQSDKASS